jgi:hypothetical protein
LAAQRKATGCAVVGCVVIALLITIAVIVMVGSIGNNNGQLKPRSTTSERYSA